MNETEARKKTAAVEEIESPKADAPAASTLKRSFNLPQDSVDALTALATDRCSSVTDVVRRAISINKILHDELKNGGKIFVEFPDDPTKPKKELIIVA